MKEKKNVHFKLETEHGRKELPWDMIRRERKRKVASFHREKFPSTFLKETGKVWKSSPLFYLCTSLGHYFLPFLYIIYCKQIVESLYTYCATRFGSHVTHCKCLPPIFLYCWDSANSTTLRGAVCHMLLSQVASLPSSSLPPLNLD